MQEELRIAFLAIGIVFIIGLLAHGAWTVRKNKRANRPNNFKVTRGGEPRFNHEQGDSLDDIDDDNIYDDVGVGQARVISNNGSTNSRDEAHDDTPSKPIPIISTDDLIASAPEHNASPNEDDYPLTGEIASETTAFNTEQVEHSDIQVPSSEDKAQSEQDPIISSPLTQADDINLSLVADSATTNGATDNSTTDNTAINSTAADSPVYSGVITQPKPGYAKHTKQSEDVSEAANIPAPPNFLLKKTNDDAPEAKSDEESTAAELRAEPKIEAPAPDFSLNVQEGPQAPEETATAQDNKESKKPEGVEKELSFAEQAKRFVTRRKKTVAEKIRKDPVVKPSAKNNDDQIRIDFEKASRIEPELSDSAPEFDTSTETPSSSQQESSASAGGEPSDVLVLNVRANADNPINGAALLPMLLTLGFKFGEHDIFHRHVNTNGKGPILFSLTNMFKPGVFDIDNIENFKTQGVSLFMMLPIEGEAQQVFNMMHNASRKIAEEFDCKVLDGNKALLSKQSLQHYSERIRDFERRRLSR
jgi:cell division protein ZipA